MMNIVRYHLDVTMPVRPPMAEAIYPAQLCTDGHYRQCIDVPGCMIRLFEAWANRNSAVLGYS